MTNLTHVCLNKHTNFLGELKHPCRHDAQNDSEVQKITHTFSIKKLISQQPFIHFFSLLSLIEDICLLGIFA